MARTKLNTQQKGFVSIIVTMIIMIILSLIVLGFAQVARREQRDSLDRQLNTQAFYAAESGINDAIKALSAPSGYLGNSGDGSKKQCGPDTSGPLSSGNVLDGSIPVEYTCLLINESLPSLLFKPVDTSKSIVIPIHASGNIAKLTVTWQAASGSSTVESGSSTDFPPVTAWPYTNGVIRIALTSLKALDRQGLIDNTYTAFLYPDSAGPGNTTFKGGAGNRSNQGEIVNGKCNVPTGVCSVDINIPPPAAPGGFQAPDFYLRIKSIYKLTAVTITAEDASSNPLTLKGTQAMIDSTGKANDVLRRIQVRVPLTNTYDYPEYVLDSADSICKLLQTAPGSTTLDPRAAGDTACDPTQ